MATVKLGSKAVGSIVTLNENGSPVNFVVAHQGLPSTAYDEIGDGTWLVRQDAHSTRVWDSSDNDYKNSDVHAWLNNTWLETLDADIQAAVKQVKIPYRAGSGGSSTVTSGANGLSCKAFLLSMKEMGLSPSDAPTEGVTLDWFSDAGNTARITELNGSAAICWSRSPYCDFDDGTTVHVVTTSGGSSTRDCASPYGVRPALVLSSELSVSDDGTVSTNEPPVITSESGTSGVDLGEKNEPFSFSYTPSDEDGDSLTVTEKLDGTTTRVRSDVTSGTALTFEAASTAAEFQKILNGQHTITIEVNDGTETATFTATFTKAVYTATITLETPMEVEGDITVARLAVTGSIPADAEYSVEVTNNGNDAEPVWQDCTAEVKSGANIVFENHENTGGAAFNFRVTVKRGSSNEGGYITGISGAFQ